jgi:hypothetical protein
VAEPPVDVLRSIRHRRGGEEEAVVDAGEQGAVCAP